MRFFVTDANDEDHYDVKKSCARERRDKAGQAWLGLAWLGLAWLGLAWLGLAWLGGGLLVLLTKWVGKNCFCTFLRRIKH